MSFYIIALEHVNISIITLEHFAINMEHVNNNSK